MQSFIDGSVVNTATFNIIAAFMVIMMIAMGICQRQEINRTKQRLKRPLSLDELRMQRQGFKFCATWYERTHPYPPCPECQDTRLAQWHDEYPGRQQLVFSCYGCGKRRL